jgi:hypothetical protein
VLVVEARNMSNPVSEFFVKPDDNIIFRLNVDDKNFYTTYSSVLKGRSSREQTDNLAREVVRFLQEVRAVPWSADK